jgi:hypothetical protein
MINIKLSKSAAYNTLFLHRYLYLSKGNVRITLRFLNVICGGAL